MFNPYIWHQIFDMIWIKNKFLHPNTPRTLRYWLAAADKRVHHTPDHRTAACVSVSKCIVGVAPVDLDPLLVSSFSAGPAALSYVSYLLVVAPLFAFALACMVSAHR